MEEVTAAEAANVNPELEASMLESQETEAPASLPTRKDVFCEIVDPVKVKGNGLTSQGYVTFCLVTKRPDGKEVKSVRRYKAFDWLRSQLRAEFPDILIPPLPEKSVLDRFAEEFIEYRRKELERFMKRILSHPILSESNSVVTFVNGSEEEIEILQNSSPVVPPKATEEEPKEKKGFFGSLKSMTFSQVSAKISGAVTAASTVAVEVMPWFETQTAYIQSLGQLLATLQSSSHNHSTKMHEMVTTLSDFSNASALLGSCESQQDEQLSQTLNRLSDILGQMSTLSQEVVATQTDVFEYAIKDYLRLVSAAREIIDYRQSMMHKWQVSAYELKSAEERAEAAKNTNSAAILAADAEAAKKKEEDLKKDFKRISKKVKRELEEFRVQKGVELREAIRNLVKANMDYELRMADLWKELLREMSETGSV